jgi:hypothetical protein
VTTRAALVRGGVALAVISSALAHPGRAQAGTVWTWVCGTWTKDNGVMRAVGGRGYTVSPGSGCPRSGLSISATGRTGFGGRAAWQTSAPAGMTLVGAWIPPYEMSAFGINAGRGFRGGFYWKGGGAVVGNWTTWTSPTFRSPYFGWRIVCGAKSCDGRQTFAEFTVYEIQLKAEENQAPALSPFPSANLFSHRGWVRGSWPVSFRATDPSGVCLTQAVANGQVLYGPSAAANQRTWHQCPDQTFAETVNTVDYVQNGTGTFPLTLKAMNAADVWTSSGEWTRNISVDDVAPTISLAGPTDAPSTAGAQYLTATAGAGPSGVSGILCSLDSAPAQWYRGATARVGVTGVGVHRLTCESANNAEDAHGHIATSAPAVRTLSIRQPAVSTVSFARIADTLRCAKKRERVTVPAQWIIERVHGHRVRVRIPAQKQTITVVRCHPRVVKRRVRVGGRWVIERVVLLPRRVLVKTKRVRFGARTVVSGWLGTAQGNALGGQEVRILTAPDNGSQAFTLAARTTTRADGTWSEHLPPGPSRLVRAVYSGASTVEPAISSIARLVVPAAVTMNISPRRTHWGGTITIRGRLRGGYVPPAGELVVLWVAWRGGSTEIGHLYAARDGRFRSTYTFLRGNGTEKYRLWATTAHETDYPFASSGSRRVSVTVGP